MTLDYGINRMPPVELWQPQVVTDFAKMVETAKKFDDSAEQVDCEDPEKVEFLKKIEARLSAMEQKFDVIYQLLTQPIPYTSVTSAS